MTAEVYGVNVKIYMIVEQMILCYTYFTESQSTLKAAYPPTKEGLIPPFERRVMPMYVTYSDLIQIGIFIVALISLIYEILKGKK